MPAKKENYMKLEDALSKINPPKTLGSLINSTLGYNEIIQHESPAGKTLEEAHAHRDMAIDRMANSNSESEYWNYQGELSAWQAACDVLEAAELVGPDNLPDITYPKKLGPDITSACAQLEGWGQNVLYEAQNRIGLNEDQV